MDGEIERNYTPEVPLPRGERRVLFFWGGSDDGPCTNREGLRRQPETAMFQKRHARTASTCCLCFTLAVFSLQPCPCTVLARSGVCKGLTTCTESVPTSRNEQTNICCSLWTAKLVKPRVGSSSTSRQTPTPTSTFVPPNRDADSCLSRLFVTANTVTCSNHCERQVLLE